jgi:hypothetical protein
MHNKIVNFKSHYKCKVELLILKAIIDVYYIIVIYECTKSLWLKKCQTNFTTKVVLFEILAKSLLHELHIDLG